jgi:hypothetical protein
MFLHKKAKNVYRKALVRKNNKQIQQEQVVERPINVKRNNKKKQENNEK